MAARAAALGLVAPLAPPEEGGEPSTADARPQSAPVPGPARGAMGDQLAVVLAAEARLEKAEAMADVFDADDRSDEAKAARKEEKRARAAHAAVARRLADGLGEAAVALEARHAEEARPSSWREPARKRVMDAMVRRQRRALAAPKYPQPRQETLATVGLAEGNWGEMGTLHRAAGKHAAPAFSFPRGGVHDAHAAASTTLGPTRDTATPAGALGPQPDATRPNARVVVRAARLPVRPRRRRAAGGSGGARPLRLPARARRRRRARSPQRRRRGGARRGARGGERASVWVAGCRATRRRRR